MFLILKSSELKTNNPIKNGQKTWTDISPKIKMTKKHMKKDSTSLERNANKVGYLFIPSTMAIIKNKINKHVDEDKKKLEPLYIAGKNVELCRHCEKQFGASSKS